MPIRFLLPYDARKVACNPGRFSLRCMPHSLPGRSAYSEMGRQRPTRHIPRLSPSQERSRLSDSSESATAPIGACTNRSGLSFWIRAPPSSFMNGFLFSSRCNSDRTTSRIDRGWWRKRPGRTMCTVRADCWWSSFSPGLVRRTSRAFIFLPKVTKRWP